LPVTPPRRRAVTKNRDLDDLMTWLSRATGSKVAAGVLTIAVVLWGYMGLGNDIESQGKTIRNVSGRLEQVEDALDSRFDRLDKRADALEKGADALEKAKSQLNEGIARAVEKGIAKGVQAALEGR
jgi:Sec-independent protein translocase protein TatA